jgi:RNA polymerase sigma-70 factor (ECF subfamily)
VRQSKAVAPDGVRDDSLGEQLDGLRQGDRAAMQAFFADQRAVVARTVRGLACSGATTEDLVQEVFVVAFTRIGGYDGSVPMPAWLRGIAVNVVRGHRRREARRGRLRQRFDPLPGERPHTPEEALATRRLADSLWGAVDALPDRQREAFVLRVIEQHSLLDCAAALGISLKAVSRRALAAERKIRAALEKGSAS